MKRLKIRIDSVTSKHVYFTIFMDGASCKPLCMLRSEAFVFINALKLGSDAANLLMEVENDEGKLFSNCGTPNGRINPKDAEVY